MRFVGTIAKFLAALVLGSALAAIITYVMATPDQFAPIVLLGIALTYLLFGSLPAIVAGIAALTVLRRLEIGRLPGLFIMTAGGAAVGAWLMTITFTGFESWGGVAGGSIGFMQALLLHRAARCSASAARG